MGMAFKCTDKGEGWMLGYAMALAWHGLRKFPRITVLSVLALALGMSATITAHTVTQLLAGNPLPSRAGQLFAVRLDARSPAQSDSHHATTVPDQLTWLDVRQLEAKRPQVAQSAVTVMVPHTVSAGLGERAKSLSDVFGVEAQSAFFRMFNVPLVAGRAWSPADDANAAPVAVIAKPLARKLFGAASALGQTIRLDGKVFRVVGVSGKWNPYPPFYALHQCIYSCAKKQVFIPVSAGRAQHVNLAHYASSDTCKVVDGVPNADKCAYLGLWARLPGAAQRASYRATLAHYASAQKAAGRFARGGEVAVGLQGVPAYLGSFHVVPLSARFGVWVAVVFLLVCLANVAGLLLTRFLRGSAELGIRRALGAPRQAIFAQCLFEAGLIGLAGGLLALPLTWGGLWLVGQQPVAYAHMIGMHGSVCVALLVLAVVASGLIGIVPAWRASIVQPGLQVKEL